MPRAVKIILLVIGIGILLYVLIRLIIEITPVPLEYYRNGQVSEAEWEEMAQLHSDTVPLYYEGGLRIDSLRIGLILGADDRVHPEVSVTIANHGAMILDIGDPALSGKSRVVRFAGKKDTMSTAGIRPYMGPTSTDWYRTFDEYVPRVELQSEGDLRRLIFDPRMFIIDEAGDRGFLPFGTPVGYAHLWVELPPGLPGIVSSSIPLTRIPLSSPVRYEFSRTNWFQVPVQIFYTVADVTLDIAKSVHVFNDDELRVELNITNLGPDPAAEVRLIDDYDPTVFRGRGTEWERLRIRGSRNWLYWAHEIPVTIQPNGTYQISYSMKLKRRLGPCWFHRTTARMGREIVGASNLIYYIPGP